MAEEPNTRDKGKEIDVARLVAAGLAIPTSLDV